MRRQVGLFVWGSSEIYWGGWQGFVSYFKSKGRALDHLHGDKKPRNNRAQLVDKKTLKVIGNYEKKNGRWSEVKKNG